MVSLSNERMNERMNERTAKGTENKNSENA